MAAIGREQHDLMKSTLAYYVGGEMPLALLVSRFESLRSSCPSLTNEQVASLDTILKELEHYDSVHLHRNTLSKTEEEAVRELLAGLSEWIGLVATESGK